MDNAENDEASGTGADAPGTVIAPPDDRRVMEALLTIMAHLRDPDHGCAWDREQTYETIAPYTIEEAYEVADAIREGDAAGLKDELGDLLLQVVFHSAIARDRGDFTFADVVEAICDKMIRRHPHIFGAEAERGKGMVDGAWEAQKAEERAAAAARRGHSRASVLEGVPLALPALMRSLKLQKRAVRIGFDWETMDGILDKITEEAGELAEEVNAGTSQARIAEEYGDLLFVMVNFGRRIGVDPENALTDANHKFERRFRRMEDLAEAEGRSLAEGASLADLTVLWNRVKAEEKGGKAP